MWDNFFFYSENNVSDQNNFEVRQGLLQPKKALFYDRQDGTGIDTSENYPNGLNLAIMLKYDIVNWFAYRNNIVTNGNNNTVDRRIATSQNFINVSQNGNGLDLTVYYIPFTDYKNISNATVLIGVN